MVYYCIVYYSLNICFHNISLHLFLYTIKYLYFVKYTHTKEIKLLEMQNDFNYIQYLSTEA